VEIRNGAGLFRGIDLFLQDFFFGREFSRPDSHSSFRRIFSCQNRRNLFETNLSLKKSYSSASSFLHRFWIYQGILEPKLDTVLLKHLYSFRGGVMLGEIGFSQLARA
jgi:hypothetical protein